MEDINDILLKYSGKEILVVLDENKKVWFNILYPLGLNLIKIISLNPKS